VPHFIEISDGTSDSSFFVDLDKVNTVGQVKGPGGERIVRIHMDHGQPQEFRGALAEAFMNQFREYLSFTK
jgi:hypothetical protein